jgi:hypothetical protein
MLRIAVFRELTETEFWERLALRIDVRRALQTLAPEERALIELLLQGKSLHSACRQLQIRNPQAVWDSITTRLKEALKGYG